MKITGLTLKEEHIPLKTPFVTSIRRVDVMTDYILEIQTDEGIIGHGACAPTPVITGDTVGSIFCAINDFFAPMLKGREVDVSLLPEIQSKLVHNTSPKAAVDLALHELLAIKNGVPLFEYLGGAKGDKHLKTDITISLEEKEKMVADTVKAVEDGFSILKIKLGRSKEDDIERIRALNDVIPKNIVVRLDANQGWSAKDSVEIAEYAEKIGMNVDLIEQPVKYYDLKGMEFVTKNTRVKILADESVFSVHDAETIIERGAADMINIKLMKCGGIYEGNRIFTLCKSHNVECMLGSMMEGAVSIASAAHFAAATGITRLDLDAPALCREIPQKMATTFESENIYINGGEPGLGIK